MLTSYHNAPFVQLRGLAQFSLSETGVVRRGTFTDDLGGAGTFTYSNIGTYACRIDPLGRETGTLADQINERSTNLLTFPPGADVTTRDTVAITNRGTYEITAVRTRTQQTLKRLEAVEA